MVKLWPRHGSGEGVRGWKCGDPRYLALIRRSAGKNTTLFSYCVRPLFALSHAYRSPYCQGPPWLRHCFSQDRRLQPTTLCPIAVQRHKPVVHCRFLLLWIPEAIHSPPTWPGHWRGRSVHRGAFNGFGKFPYLI
jgi:hypothetical protein